MKPRKLQTFKFVGGDAPLGMQPGGTFTIEGEFVDRWFDPMLRKLRRFKVAIMHPIFWWRFMR